MMSPAALFASWLHDDCIATAPSVTHCIITASSLHHHCIIAASEASIWRLSIEITSLAHQRSPIMLFIAVDLGTPRGSWRGQSGGSPGAVRGLSGGCPGTVSDHGNGP